MINMNYSLTVPGFSQQEIGFATLVRCHRGKFQLTVTNDGVEVLRGLRVRPVLESYVGQEKPQLFMWLETQVISEISSKSGVSLGFEFRPLFPGLVSVAIYMTDEANTAVKAKRKTDSDYQQAPVRWWLHVVDNISLETLRALKALVTKRGNQ